MKIVQRVQEIWRGQESVMDRMTDGLNDGWMDGRMDGQMEGIPITPHPLRGV